MKKYLTISILSITTFSCTYKKISDPGCGCETNKIKAEYVNKDALLYYLGKVPNGAYQPPMGWHISLKDDAFTIGGPICTESLQLIKNITDTLDINRVVDVVFTGYVTKPCNPDSFGFFVPGDFILQDFIIKKIQLK